MLKKLFSRKTKYQNFWKWFSEFDPILHQAFKENHEHKAMFQLLKMRLKNVHRDISFELGFTPNSDKIELIISPSGSIDAFPHVKKLISESIETTNWTFTPFKQRKISDFQECITDNFSLNYKDIYFEQLEAGKKLGVKLFIRGFKNNEEFIGATYVLLDALIGEYDVTFEIDFIQWDRLKEHQISQLLPFTELRSIVDARKSRNNSDNPIQTNYEQKNNSTSNSRYRIT